MVVAVENDPADANYPSLQANLSLILSMATAERNSLQIVELPMPPPVLPDGHRMPASYANYYIANEIVLMPAYGSSTDERAASILRELFPTRKIVALDCTDVIWGLGAFHCLTQQVPAV